LLRSSVSAGHRQRRLTHLSRELNALIDLPMLRSET
jgi:hypothetical protein